MIKKGVHNDKVNIGSTIEVQKGSKMFKYTIVGSKEARPEADLISNESPLGKAFIGGKIGDKVEINTPNGKVDYKIIKIE